MALKSIWIDFNRERASSLSASLLQILMQIGKNNEPIYYIFKDFSAFIQPNTIFGLFIVFSFFHPATQDVYICITKF